MNLENLKSKIWRLNNLYKIVDKKGNLIKFRENKHQCLVNRDPSNEKIILKARQIGFSTSCIIDLFDTTIWNENKTSVILAHENDSIKKLFRIVWRAYKFMPDDLKPTIDRGGGSKYEFFFPEINSRIYCDLESRSDTIQNLHISEYGLMKNDDKVRATLDAVPIDGKVTYESTPKGLNHFYEKWTKGSGKKFFFPWYAVEEYQIPCGDIKYTDEEIEIIGVALSRYKINLKKEQIAFRRWKIEQKGGGKRGLRTFKEEFPEDDQSCFLTSGDPVMDLFLITNLIEKSEDPIEDNGWMQVFEKYDKNKRYVIGSDTAEGTGSDYSVAVVLEVSTRKIVAIIRGQFKPYDFAHKIKDLAEKYSGPSRPPPLVGVERNNHGHAVLLELDKHICYQNLYYHNDDKVGWKTDLVSRPIMINAFIDAVENKYLSINSKIILNECLTLVNENGKIQAAEGKHDDCIVAVSIALQLAVQNSNSVFDDIENKILI